MTTTMTNTIREIVLENPHATRVFAKLGIDYCCGGGKSLEEACRAANLPLAEVQHQLDHESVAGISAEKNWQVEPLTELAQHIVQKHHSYVKASLPRIAALFEKVCAKHGASHSELNHQRTVFHGLNQELSTHLMKEEAMLFPYIERMEEAVLQGDPILPAPFGTVANPVHMMMLEHDNAGGALRALRQSSCDYTLPADSCMSYQTLYRELQEFEADLHQHIHLENNILFPRALALEQGR
jgi:regulator of cell morphogenesis and NO signaling